MRTKRYPVNLDAESRRAAERIARSYRRSERERQHARILLRAAEGETDAAIATVVGSCVATVGRVRRHCAEEG